MLLCPHELAFESIPQVCILSEPVVLAGVHNQLHSFPLGLNNRVPTRWLARAERGGRLHRAAAARASTGHLS